ncbi:hypothetical protein J8L85_02535 [Maribacter sp. MMG018]|uniref:hypothetical protein n=1 Tax=Maribacter sp. MMG018 TaxID=2822688 RepID=UPI001B37989C|nr:hypothetical protein [Maribacter sp. MMG018]MBQ4913299.1 hypothetical protein [Maribacter sp. MMG018]
MKANVYILIVMIALFAGCKLNSQDRLIRNFVENAILKEDVSNLSAYLALSNRITNKAGYQEFFEKNFKSIKDSMGKGCEAKYTIKDYKSAESMNLEDFNRYKQNYVAFENVYFVVCGKKIILPVITENNKIISFQTGIVKKKDQDLAPYLLN